MCIRCSRVEQNPNTNRNQNNLKEQIEEKLLELMNDRLDKVLSAKSEEESDHHLKSFEYFKKSLIEIKTIYKGSVIWTLIFKSVRSLKGFWKDYKTGLIKDIFQNDFITEELLSEFSLQAAELEVSLRLEEFDVCLKELTGIQYIISNKNIKLLLCINILSRFYVYCK